MTARVVQAWDRWLFTPQSTATMGLLRIALGLVTLFWALALGPDVLDFFGSDAIVAESTTERGGWTLLDAWGSDTGTVVLYVLMVVAAVLTTVGLGTRVATAVLWVLVMSFERRNAWVFNSGDLLLRNLLFFLVLMPAGAALSLDRWIRHRPRFWEHPRRAPWALRLVMLQVCFVYAFTVVSKVQGNTWLEGTAVGIALQIEDHARFMPPGALFDSPLLVNLMTWGTLVTEIALAVGLWVARWRPWVVLAGIGMHLIIDLTITVGFFSFIMIASYLAFTPGPTADRWAHRWRIRRQRARAPEAGPPQGTVAGSVPVGAQILDGKATAAEIRADLKQRVAVLRERGITPGLATVLVGDDPGSAAYVAGKHKDCAEVGIASIRRDLPAAATQEQVESVVAELNADPACTGYIVQLPLPKGLDAGRVLERMDPAKDADGLHPTSLGRLVLGEPGPLPCTPRACVELLRRYGVPLAGADVVVIGRGVTVGRPIGLLLTRRSENATVTLCHTGTKDLAGHLRRADVIVAAAGVPGLVTAENVKPGAAVLDVGITRTDAGLVGDVEVGVREVAAFVAPMPGGVGPMTRAMLLLNVVEAAEAAG